MTDFGISKQLEQTFGMARSFVGTAAYMAPERIAGDDYGTAADIWAVGIVLCECAQGAHPYKHMQSYYDLVLELSEGGRPPRGVPAFLPEREFRERAKVPTRRKRGARPRGIRDMCGDGRAP